MSLKRNKTERKLKMCSQVWILLYEKVLKCSSELNKKLERSIKGRNLATIGDLIVIVVARGHVTRAQSRDTRKRSCDVVYHYNACDARPIESENWAVRMLTASHRTTYTQL